MCSRVLLIVVVGGCFVHVSNQQIRFVDNSPPSQNSNDPHYLGIETFSELPPNISIPKPDSHIVMSELNEPDKNRSNILQWILGIAGITPKPVIPDNPTPPENCPPCQCGRTNKLNRIVGGQETQVNEYPWMTLLKYGNRFYCGAALISDKYLLTAAHCIATFDYKRITAYLLEHDRTRHNETQTLKRRITKSIKHPNYNTRNYDNDIALLRLNESVPLGGNVRPVCLPPPGDFAGSDGVVTGWGAIDEGGPLATRLREVTVPILSNEECKKTAYGANRITGNMMCAGFPEGKKDSCQGDSGGPLHVAMNNIYFEVGVVSWGQGCAAADYPGVYSRVNNYKDWIMDNTKDACFC